MGSLRLGYLDAECFALLLHLVHHVADALLGFVEGRMLIFSKVGTSECRV